MWWPDWKAVCTCRQTPSTHSKRTRVLSQRLDGLYQLHRKNESSRERYPCVNGRHKPIHKYTSRGGDRHGMRSIRIGNPPSLHNILKGRLSLYFKKTHSGSLKKLNLQTRGTAMGTKMTVAFANVFMGKVESQILSQSALKPLAWKRYIDDIFSIWNINKDEVTQFIHQANSHHLLSSLRLKFPTWKQRSSNWSL